MYNFSIGICRDFFVVDLDNNVLIYFVIGLYVESLFCIKGLIILILIFNESIEVCSKIKDVIIKKDCVCGGKFCFSFYVIIRDFFLKLRKLLFLSC